MNAVNEFKSDIFFAYNRIFEQYADDASFLWLLRSMAVNQPNYNQQDIAELDRRISAQIDGLLSAPEESWSVCNAALKLKQPGEVFTSATVAFHSLDVKKIQTVVESALDQPSTIDALAHAMAWLPDRIASPWIVRFFSSKNLDHKYLALKICLIENRNPHEHLTNILQRSDCKNHQELYCAAIRLIGEIKRFDLVTELRNALKSENSDIKFWAIRSLILLGDKEPAKLLGSYITSIGPLQILAIDIGIRTVSISQSREWISHLAKNPQHGQQAIYATQTLGDPRAIDWILAQMHKPSLLRYAGEAFSQITGLDLESHNLTLQDIPDLDDIIPDDTNTASNISLPDDQFLPFPDIHKVTAVWQKYKSRYLVDHRYLMGQLLGDNQQTFDHLIKIHCSGNQRQRAAAALEISLRKPSHILLNHTKCEVKDD